MRVNDDIKRRIYARAYRGSRICLLARELFPEECKTKNGYKRASARVSNHIKGMVSKQWLRARYSNRGSIIWIEKGHKYREFESLYIAQETSPTLDHRAMAETYEVNLHHDKYSIKVNRMNIIPIDWTDGWMADHTDVKVKTVIEPDVPPFKMILYSDKTIVVSLIEPLEMADHRTMREHRAICTARFMEVWNYIQRTWGFRLGLPDDNRKVDRHYSIPVPKAIAQKVKEQTKHEKNPEVWGDTSPEDCIETRNDTIADCLMALPSIVSDIRQVRGMGGNVQALHSRILDIEEGVVKIVGAIGEMTKTVSEMHQRQSRLIDNLNLLIGSMRGDSPTETAIDPLRDNEEDYNTDHYIG